MQVVPGRKDRGQLKGPYRKNKTIPVFPFLLILLSVVFSHPAQSLEPSPNIRIQVQFRSATEVRQNVSPYHSRRQDNQTQFLVLREGLEGRLFVGENVPYVTWYRNYFQEEGYLAKEVVFRNVGTSLIVRARIIGDQIEISLTPEVSYQSKDGKRTIAVTKLSTTVITSNGQPVEIGGSVRASEFERNFYRRETGETLSIVLTPLIMKL